MRGLSAPLLSGHFASCRAAFGCARPLRALRARRRYAVPAKAGTGPRGSPPAFPLGHLCGLRFAPPSAATRSAATALRVGLVPLRPPCRSGCALLGLPGVQRAARRDPPAPALRASGPAAPPPGRRGASPRFFSPRPGGFLCSRARPLRQSAQSPSGLLGTSLLSEASPLRPSRPRRPRWGLRGGGRLVWGLLRRFLILRNRRALQGQKNGNPLRLKENPGSLQSRNCKLSALSKIETPFSPASA